MKQNKAVRSWIYVFIAGCLWGIQGGFVKLMAAYGSSSSYTSFLRMFIGFLLMVVITLIFDGPKAFKINKRTLLSCILLGLISQAIYNVTYSSAVTGVGVALASVLLYTAPVFTAIFSFVLFKEGFSKRKGIALLVNIVGCALTVTGGRLAGLTLKLSGILFGLAAGICYALTPILGRIASNEKASPYAIATYNFLFASIFLALLGKPWSTVANPFDLHIVGYGVLLALLPTALAYIFYFSALSTITETGRVPVVASIEVVVATLLGLFAFGENMGVVHICGIVLVLLSIVITSSDGNRKAKPE